MSVHTGEDASEVLQLETKGIDHEVDLFHQPVEMLLDVLLLPLPDPIDFLVHLFRNEDGLLLTGLNLHRLCGNGPVN